MAEAQASEDYQTFLDTVWEDMLDYMEPDPILSELLQKPSTIPRRMLRDLKDYSGKKTDKISDLLKLVKEYGHVACDQLKQCLRISGQDTLSDLLEVAEKGGDLSALRETLLFESAQSPEEKLFKGLKEDLITYYLANESTMPVAPLAEQHDTELTNFYVRPPMMAYKKPNAFGQEKQSDELVKTPIDSYRDLLFKNNEPYEKIYVTADAGMGKTSFSKMLARTWCQAHRPGTPQADKFNEDDVNTMKEFDFVFLIYLRDYQSKDICRLDDMILCMITSNLPRPSSYSKELLEKLLCNKRCLTIVDGLDEWIHPMECKNPPRKEIPHTTVNQGCSVLTTTRPWKFSTSRLSTGDVNRQVEISQLDAASSWKLVTLAINFLNDNQAGEMVEKKKCKRYADLIRAETAKSLGFFCYIPYILLQMVCLWFRNNSIGKSLCELYSNIVELTLTRWLVKTDSGHENCKCNAPDTDIKCMKNNTHCRCYKSLLQKISKLAFDALFGKIKEKSLLFDKNFVLQYLEQKEFDLCLEIGLLSQVKDTIAVASVRFKVMFHHKSIQEFFAALHIASDWDGNVRKTISDMCTSLSSILEMSNVFIFVCGMKPELYYSISRQFAEIVSQDPRITRYRRFFSDYRFEVLAVLNYQSMQVDCFQESIRNEHGQCQIVLDDLIVRESQITVDNMNALTKIIRFNTSSMKSLNIGNISNERGEICQILCQSNLSSLECLFGSGKTAQLFLSSINTASGLSDLKYLSLENMSLTNGITFMNSLNTLQSLYLNNVTFTSDSLIRYDSNCEQSEQRGLTDVKYRTHRIRDTSSPCSLQRDPPVGKLLMKTVDLTYCSINLSLPHKTIQSLFASIQKNILLTRLMLMIRCADHPSGCSGVALDLRCHNKLEELSIADNIFVYDAVSLIELHIKTDQLVECSVGMKAFSADSVSSFLAELNKAPTLKTLRLQNIRHTAGRVVIPCLRRLKKCELSDCDLGDSILSLSPELNSLETLTFTTTEMSKSSYREAISGISSLPQSMMFNMSNIKMKAVKWNEVFTCICQLPQNIIVELTYITIEADQWREAITCINMLQLPLAVTMRNITTTKEQQAEVKTCNKELIPPIKLSPITVIDGQCAHIGNSEPISVNLEDTTMTTDQWREMFTSIREISLHASVELCSIILTSYQWRDVFTSISSLPQQITVNLSHITVEADEWRDAVTCINMLQLPVAITLSNITTTKEQQADVFSRTEELSGPIMVKLRQITVTDGQCAHTSDSKPISVKLTTTDDWGRWKRRFTSIRERLYITMTSDQWREMFTSIGKLPRLHIARLSDITVTLDQWKESFTIISKLPQLHIVRLSDITMTTDKWREFFISISKLSQLQTVELSGIIVTNDQWREFFTSISKLPQSVTVEMNRMKMTSKQWRELLFDIIGKLPHTRHVKLNECEAPSVDQCDDIIRDLNSSPAFNGIPSYLLPWGFNAEFDVKGI